MGSPAGFFGAVGKCPPAVCVFVAMQKEHNV